MKIGEKLSDFTLCKLITIVVKIFTWSIRSRHSKSEELKYNQNGTKDLNFKILTLIRKHYTPHDMIDHCIVVFAVVVVLTCVMWWLQWLNTISIIAQVIIEMHMLLLVKDCIIPCYNHHAWVIIARALNFIIAALHFVKYLWGSDKSNSRQLNCEEHERY